MMTQYLMDNTGLVWHFNEMPHLEFQKDEIISNIFYCYVCGANESTLWRQGPDGPKTLCNTCGLNYFRLKKKRGTEFIVRAFWRYFQEPRKVDELMRKLFCKNCGSRDLMDFDEKHTNVCIKCNPKSAKKVQPIVPSRHKDISITALLES